MIKYLNISAEMGENGEIFRIILIELDLEYKNKRLNSVKYNS